MKKIYTNATDDVYAMMDDAIRHHPHLVENEVKIAIVMIAGYDKEDMLVPATKEHGAYSPGMVSLVKGKRRVNNQNDVEIFLDQHFVDHSPREKTVALIDHELEHVQMVLDRNGIVSVDETTGRKKLKLKPDDWTLTGFLSVVRRHGDNANEAASVLNIAGQVDTVLEALTNGAEVLSSALNYSAPSAQPQLSN